MKSAVFVLAAHRRNTMLVNIINKNIEKVYNIEKIYRFDRKHILDAAAFLIHNMVTSIIIYNEKHSALNGFI